MTNNTTHRMYCGKSGMTCLVHHPDGICPDVRDCEGCHEETAVPIKVTETYGRFITEQNK